MTNVNDIKNLTEGIKKIADILWDIDPQHTYSEDSISQIEKFVKRINRHYPFDSIDALDMVNVVLNHYYVPRPETIDILEEIFKKAEFVRGELHWKYHHPFLTASFFPKDTSGRYDIIFTSISKDGTVPISAVSFPLKVTFHEWANMDEKEYHDEAVCSLYYPEHDDDCSVVKLFTDELYKEPIELSLDEEIFHISDSESDIFTITFRQLIKEAINDKTKFPCIIATKDWQ